MSPNAYKMYINGQWVSHDETFADYNPATAEVWAEIPNGTREHAKKAIASAAAAVANDSEYGLSAGIITRDEEKGLALAHRLQTGMAHINDSSVNDEPYVPFGGMKNSGLGRHGGKASIETFTELRWLTLERGGRQYPPPFLVKPSG